MVLMNFLQNLFGTLYYGLICSLLKFIPFCTFFIWNDFHLLNYVILFLSFFLVCLETNLQTVNAHILANRP